MVYVIADIHGSLQSLQERIRLMPMLTEDDYIIIAGDAGLMYGDYNMGSVKKFMKKLKCKFIIIRGNHDNRYHDYARQNPDTWMFSDDGMYAWENKYPNILYVKDGGGVYSIGGNSILFIPGAYSVDKPYRLARGLPFETREELTIDEADNLLEEAEQVRFDYVVSHTCPYFLLPKLQYLFLDYVDQSKVSYWTEKICQAVYDNIGGNYKAWYFGHFHDDRYFEEENLTMVYNSFEVITGDE